MSGSGHLSEFGHWVSILGSCNFIEMQAPGETTIKDSTTNKHKITGKYVLKLIRIRWTTYKKHIGLRTK